LEAQLIKKENPSTTNNYKQDSYEAIISPRYEKGFSAPYYHRI